MFDFHRQAFTGNEFQNLTDREIDHIPVYAPFAHLPIGSKRHSARDVLVIARRVLGDALVTQLIAFGHAEAVHTAAEIIDDHLYMASESTRKDLQMNLVLNIVKEIANVDGIHAAKRYEVADDLMRKLNLDPEFKRQLKSCLYDTNAISRSCLLITRWPV
jgi:hypothetical protein